MSDRTVSDEALPRHPWDWITQWLPANDEAERPAMTVATIGLDGLPDARTQLLSEYDDEGFYFHEDARSRKAAQLAANPGVALVLRFPESARQLVIQGHARPAPPDEVQRAYRCRSPYLQQLAWQNTPEFASLPLPRRIAAWEEYRSRHPEGFAPPPTWAGHLVVPVRLSFWFGRDDTASRRVEFRRARSDTPASADAWTVDVLAG